MQTNQTKMNPINNQFDAHVNVNLNNQYWLQVYNYIQMNQKRPVGVFWDIENCSIPKNVSTSLLVEKIRSMFAQFNLIENEFVVVCDVFGVANNIITELNNMQVNIIHVSSFSKNACDEKLKQLMLRFVNTHGQNCCIMLFSSDINFAPVLTDVKNRIGVFVILFHHQQVSPALIASATFHFDYDAFCCIPYSNNHLIQHHFKQQKNIEQTMTSLIISNLPKLSDQGHIRAFLNRITNNAGGRIINVDMNVGEAIVSFRCQSDASRCQQRVNNRKFYGSFLKAHLQEYKNQDNNGRNLILNRYQTSQQQPESSSQMTISDNRTVNTVNIKKPFDQAFNQSIYEANSCLSCMMKNREKSIHSNFLFQNSTLSVNISLKTLAKNLKQLLVNHSGKLPLNALPNCWLNNFSEEFDTITAPKVLLEHLVCSVPGVTIQTIGVVLADQTIMVRFIVLDSQQSLNESSSKMRKRVQKKLIHFGDQMRSLIANRISDECFKFPVIKLKDLEQEYDRQFNNSINYEFYGCSSLLELITLLNRFNTYFCLNEYYIGLNFDEQILRFIKNLLNLFFGNDTSKNYDHTNQDLSNCLGEHFRTNFDPPNYGVCYVEDLFDALINLKSNSLKDIESSQLIFLKNLILNNCIALDNHAVVLEFQKIIPKLQELLISRPDFSMDLKEFHENFISLLQTKSIVEARSFLQTLSLLLNFGKGFFEILESDQDEYPDKLILSINYRFTEIGCRFINIFKKLAIIFYGKNAESIVDENYGISIYEILYYYFQRYASINLKHFGASNFFKFFEKIISYLFQHQIHKNHCLVYTYNNIYLYRFVDQWKQNLMHHLFMFLFENFTKTIVFNSVKRYFHNRFGFYFGMSLFNDPDMCSMFKILKNEKGQLIITLHSFYEFASMCLVVMLLHEKIVFPQALVELDMGKERPKWNLDQLDNEFYDHFGISMKYSMQDNQCDYLKSFSTLDWLFEMDVQKSTIKTIRIKQSRILGRIDLKNIPSCNYCCSPTNDDPSEISGSDLDQIFAPYHPAPIIPDQSIWV